MGTLGPAALVYVYSIYSVYDLLTDYVTYTVHVIHSVYSIVQTVYVYEHVYSAHVHVDSDHSIKAPLQGVDRLQYPQYNSRMQQYKVKQDWSAAVKAAHEWRTNEMTLPDERYRAVLAAEQLLRDLTNPKMTPRVPGVIRDRARAVLRHFPREYDMSKAAQTSPDIFRAQLEDVERFILQGSLDKHEKS